MTRPTATDTASSSEGGASDRSSDNMVIVVAVSDDESSWKAAQFAGRLANDDDTVIVLNVASEAPPIHRPGLEVRVLDWLAYGALVLVPPVAPVMPPPDLADEGADQVVRDDSLEVDGVDLPANLDGDLVLAVGNPIERICALADQVSADLVVVGTSDPGILSRVFAGESVSRGVVEKAPCSVLVVR